MVKAKLSGNIQLCKVPCQIKRCSQNLKLWDGMVSILFWQRWSYRSWSRWAARRMRRTAAGPAATSDLHLFHSSSCFEALWSLLAFFFPSLVPSGRVDAVRERERHDRMTRRTHRRKNSVHEIIHRDEVVHRDEVIHQVHTPVAQDSCGNAAITRSHCSCWYEYVLRRGSVFASAIRFWIKNCLQRKSDNHHSLEQSIRFCFSFDWTISQKPDETKWIHSRRSTCIVDALWAQPILAPPFYGPPRKTEL